MSPEPCDTNAQKSARSEPRMRRKRMLKRLYLKLPFRFPLRFLYVYFFKLGFLDGRPGFILSVLLSFYDFLAWAKHYELQTPAKREERGKWTIPS